MGGQAGRKHRAMGRFIVMIDSWCIMMDSSRRVVDGDFPIGWGDAG